MRLAVILQHAIMACHVQIAHEFHIISRLDSCRVRKSCYRPILRLRHLSLIVHSPSKLVHVYLLLLVRSLRVRIVTELTKAPNFAQ